MKAVYLESSALLQWLLGQSGAAEVRRHVDQAEVVLTSMLTFTEAERTLLRAENQGLLRGGDAQLQRVGLRRPGTALAGEHPFGEVAYRFVAGHGGSSRGLGPKGEKTRQHL